MRRHINWFQVLQKVMTVEMSNDFFELFSKLRKGKSMSHNRCAYYVLKKYYSTTTIDELCERLGI